MRQTISNLSLAFLIGAIAALIVDVALQNALAAVRSPGVASMTPWWVIGRVLERGVWVMAAALVWLGGPWLSRITMSLWPPEHVVHRAAAFDFVGRAMLVAPLIWLVATWLVVAARMTLSGTWGSDGGMFLTGYYYYNLVVAYAPWAGGGVTLLALTRHVARD